MEEAILSTSASGDLGAEARRSWRRSGGASDARLGGGDLRRRWMIQILNLLQYNDRFACIIAGGYCV